MNSSDNRKIRIAILLVLIFLVVKSFNEIGMLSLLKAVGISF